MNVVLCHGEDFAGVHAHLAEAINKTTDHCCRTVSAFPHEYGYKTDLVEGVHDSEISRVVNNADYVLYNQAGEYPYLKDYKGLVGHHFHGSELRGNWSGYNKFVGSSGDDFFVSTFDLLAYLPGSGRVEWLPNPVDTDFLRPAGLGEKFERFTVFHAPSNPIVKGSFWVVNAVERLRSMGFEIDLRLVSGVSWNDTILDMRRSHVLFDKMLPMDLFGYYGCTAVEACALGVPVVINPFVFPVKTPFFECSPAELVAQLHLAFMTWKYDKGLWDVIGGRHRRFAEAVHSYPVVARKFFEVVEKGRARRAG